ncbi:MAG TPA: AAA family ATPase [Bacteroidetes bacterium]|nr:AAA family ATPase [Bacteroidota bacterium]
MIQRKAKAELEQLSREFKAVSVIGPRQSGKTTLVRSTFLDKPYVSLENPDTRQFATDDPRGFLDNFIEGAIIDEIQRVPQLFSYLQQRLDESNQKGLFILTGSNNFLIQEQITQSLAGRIAILNLLPLSIQEIGELRPHTLDEMLIKGSYPELYAHEISPIRWHNNYIQTYLERDVRLIRNIGNLQMFERFIRLCAARIGQLLNMNSLAIETGIDMKTVSAWLSVLESSFVVFRLKPHHANFNKRIVKMPKLYFCDTGLAAALLGIERPDQMNLHPMRGNLFENLIVADLLKNRYNLGLPSNLYFWRDNVGHEVDIIQDQAGELTAIEIKSGRTITPEFFKGLNYWNSLTQTKGGMLIYGGDKIQKRSDGISILPWSKLAETTTNK